VNNWRNETTILFLVKKSRSIGYKLILCYIKPSYLFYKYIFRSYIKKYKNKSERELYILIHSTLHCYREPEEQCGRRSLLQLYSCQMPKFLAIKKPLSHRRPLSSTLIVQCLLEVPDVQLVNKGSKIKGDLINLGMLWKKYWV